MKKRAGLALLALTTLFAACHSKASHDAAPDAAPDGQKTDGGGQDAAVDTGDAADAAAGCPPPKAGPTMHTSTITADELWTADGSPHLVPYDLAIKATVTVEACAEVRIDAGKTISVVKDGKLAALGMAGRSVRIVASDKTTPFGRIQVGGGGRLHFAYTVIENGGDPSNSVVDITGALYAQGADQSAPTEDTVFVDHVTVSGSRSNGLYMAEGAGFAPGSQELTVTGSAQYPLSIWPRQIDSVPSGTYTGNAIDEILLPGGGGYQAVQEDATMRDRGIPYRVGNSLSGSNPALLIENQEGASGLATLTIEAGVKIRVKKGGFVEVQRFAGDAPARGALIVEGTADKPVVFTSAEATPAAGDWLGIWFGEIPAPSDKIAFARIEYAGGTSSSGSAACNTGTNDAAIRLFGLPSGAFVTNTTIVKSAGHGIDRGWRDDMKPDFLPTNTFVDIAGCKQSFPEDTNGACPMTVPCP